MMVWRRLLNSSILKSPLLRPRYLMTLIASVISGVLLSLFLHDYAHMTETISLQRRIHHSETYNTWLHSYNISRQTGQPDVTSAAARKSDLNNTISEATYLHQKVRVLCFVILKPSALSRFSLWGRTESAKEIKRDAIDISTTWGKRCTKLVFFTPIFDDFDVPEVTILPIKTRGDASSWSALHESLVKISNNHLNDFDWFLTVGRDSYVILENLRYYLSVFNPNEAHYMGQIVDSWLSVSYNSYSAGIVLSAGSLRKLHNAFIQGHCAESSSDADAELGRCLSNVGVYPVDTRDEGGRSAFLPFDPETHLIPGTRTLKFWESHGRHRLREVRLIHVFEYRS